MEIINRYPSYHEDPLSEYWDEETDSYQFFEEWDDVIPDDPSEKYDDDWVNYIPQELKDDIEHSGENFDGISTTKFDV